jgi:hypothetical protein
MQILKLRLEALETRNQLQAPACPKRIHLWALSQGLKTPPPTRDQTAAQWLALLPTTTLLAIIWRHEDASA